MVGISAEARLVASLGQVVVGGGARPGAVRAVGELIRNDVSALLSFGIAGGLSPELPAGTLIVPNAVWVAGRRILCDRGLVEWLGGATAELIADAPAMVSGIEDKAALWRQSGAAAVDLESGPLALAAEQAGLPFAVMRAICDPAERSLPAVVHAALDADGSIRILNLLAGLVVRPSQITVLVRLAVDAFHARRSLRAAVTRLERDRRKWNHMEA